MKTITVYKESFFEYQVSDSVLKKSGVDLDDQEALAEYLEENHECKRDGESIDFININ